MPAGATVGLENAGAAGPWLLVCEHASNAFPDPWGDLGLSPEAQEAHIAWDPGALPVARGLAQALDAPLVAGSVSRLIYDLNRPPHVPGAMTERSEVWDIPGNRNLTPAARLARTEAVYLPFHAAVSAQVAGALAQGRHPVLATIHSFTPTWHGRPRSVELGIIHDADPALALAVVEAARRLTGLRVALNDPYSAADGVTHSLRLHATPYGLPNVMIEIRNDLIATPETQAEMAAKLARVLDEALAAIHPREGVA
ncbi:N-formylglutamate amidohydrolase [Frigidibacter sp. ROC022]|uniref:N-formylglutamate amidohydrolase n=1 Tax=Frigidibacter sp. ROC022 TaxID=2971796 RepID=UPI00215B10BC|nr:N-formylglutamate amidohydrolase [Frigidibacter sp. ROC022]MCR8725102.1 N-formylglutamate amidohydrolase [Frigidibacter sp. ROC022]